MNINFYSMFGRCWIGLWIYSKICEVIDSYILFFEVY